ncbi:MAG: hypothetical protein E7620_02960 [Ruminococcaceae bacterium]|nr:hypothetical protein [Oscillospiraceae bacterium]
MRRYVFLLCACLLLSFSAVLPVCADGEIPYLTDAADLLTVAQEKELTEQAESLSLRLGFPVAMYVYSSLYESDNFIGEDFLRLHEMSATEDLILLVVKQEKTQYANTAYYYDLYLYGMGEKRIALEEVDPLLDDPNVFQNLKAGRIDAGLKGYLNAVDGYASNEVDRPNPFLKALIWAFPVSLAAGVIACVCVKISYSMKRKSVDYPLERFAKLQLTEESDMFVGKHVTRRVISSSSGGSGGGGSRGGGRGHAGGR